MSRKAKFSPVDKIKRVELLLDNIIDDAIAMKRHADFFPLVVQGLCQLKAVTQAEYDDDLLIAKLWVTIEQDVFQARGFNARATQLPLELKNDKKK